MRENSGIPKSKTVNKRKRKIKDYIILYNMVVHAYMIRMQSILGVSHLHS